MKGFWHRICKYRLRSIKTRRFKDIGRKEYVAICNLFGNIIVARSGCW